MDRVGPRPGCQIPDVSVPFWDKRQTPTKKTAISSHLHSKQIAPSSLGSQLQKKSENKKGTLQLNGSVRIIGFPQTLPKYNAPNMLQHLVELGVLQSSLRGIFQSFSHGVVRTLRESPKTYDKEWKLPHPFGVVLCLGNPPPNETSSPQLKKPKTGDPVTSAVQFLARQETFWGKPRLVTPFRVSIPSHLHGT